jgi:hypothetical protein
MNLRVANDMFESNVPAEIAAVNDPEYGADSDGYAANSD